jgi:tetratricopeptide (TPR) repeat protein
MERAVGAARELIPDLIDSLHTSAAQHGASHPESVATAHRLAIAFWNVGDAGQAIHLLKEALETIASNVEHPVRPDLLCTLGEVMADDARWKEAAEIYREALAACIRRLGPYHPRSIAAKSDLAAVLFELGQTSEADQLERDAYQVASLHLGMKHAVTCVLAWNRVLRWEESGKVSASSTELINGLEWLLAEDDQNLQADQLAIKAMLLDRRKLENTLVC